MKELDLNNLSADAVEKFKAILSILTSEGEQIRVYDGQCLLYTILKGEEGEIYRDKSNPQTDGKPSDVFERLEECFDQDRLDKIGTRSDGEAQNQRDYEKRKRSQVK